MSTASSWSEDKRRRNNREKLGAAAYAILKNI